MKIALNIAIFNFHDNLNSHVDVCLKHGIKNIELPIRLLQEQENYVCGFEQMQIVNFTNLLHSTNIFPLSIFAEEDIYNEQFTFLSNKLELCRKYNCLSISLSIDPWVNMDIIKARILFIKRVRDCADMAQRYGLTINLEYISPFIARKNGMRGDWLFCRSLNAVADLLSDISRKNVKLLLDFLHWYADENQNDLQSFAKEIGLVHICDHVETNMKKINDNGRVLPFEGQLPIENFISTLKQLSYSGVVSIEVFKTDSYAPDYLRIKNSIKKLQRVING